MTSLDADGAGRGEARATVERHVEMDVPADDVWEAVCTPDAWLADEGSIDVRPGGRGRLVEDGVVHHVVVETVETVETVESGRRLVYRWWRDGEAGSASRVEITVRPSDGPTHLVVRETRVAARAALRWEVRLTCLAFLGALVRV